MIDLYALTSPNVQKIYIMLEETKLPYKEHFVDVWKGEQYNPDFIKINPNSKIPAIVDHEGPGGKPYVVFESGAILLYLAEKTGKFLPQDIAKRYEVLQWLMFQLTGIGPMFGQFTHFKLFAPKDNAYFDDALSDRGEAPLRGHGKALGALAVPRRRRIFACRHRHLSVDAQS
jgi:GSH-dependent disulfide-bond oxidoreductase